ncbi:MAG: type III secretion system needle filament subunit SctF [Candidatus Symbiodolus clandestinus]
MNLDNILSTLRTTAEQGIESVNANLDYKVVNNPQEMLANQWMVMQYSSYLSYGSSLLKMYRDLLSGIIAKI